MQHPGTKYFGKTQLSATVAHCMADRGGEGEVLRGMQVIRYSCSFSSLAVATFVCQKLDRIVSEVAQIQAWKWADDVGHILERALQTNARLRGLKTFLQTKE